MSSILKVFTVGLVGAFSLVLAGCDLATVDRSSSDEEQQLDELANSPLEDHAGVRLSDAHELSLEEHYLLAQQRYEQFNDFFAEIQTQVMDELWMDGGVLREIAVVDGASITASPEGATEDNSYFFRVDRYQHVEPEDTRAFIDEVAESWKDNGWTVETQKGINNIRYVTTLEDGTWLAVDEQPEKERIGLTSRSPVYWGPYWELAAAVREREEAELDAGQDPWTSYDSDGRPQATLRQPGDYEPFPAWEAVEEPDSTEELSWTY